MLKIGLFLQTRWVSKEVDRVSAWDIPTYSPRRCAYGHEDSEMGQQPGPSSSTGSLDMNSEIVGLRLS
jgi:hypothetical protein